MPDYEIDVGVVPDGSRFPEQLSSIVGKAEARQDPLEVELAPKVGRDFGREAQRKVRAAIASLDAELNLQPSLSRSFRRDVERLAREALAGANISVAVDAVLGRGFRRDLQGSVKEATAGAEIAIPVQAQLGPGFRAKLQRLIREALAANPLEASVQLTVDKRTLPEFYREVASQTAQATAAAAELAPVQLRSDAGLLDAQVAAQVLAATEAVSASEAGSVEIRADTAQATAQIAQLGLAEQGASEKGADLGKVGRSIGLGFAAAAAGVAAAGFALFKVGEEFDSSFDRIATTTGKTGAALAGLQDDFRAVAAVVPSSFEDISVAVAGVNQRLGLTGPLADQVAGQLLNLSRITGTDLGANLENAAGALQSFGIEGAAIPGALDVLFRASQSSGVAVDALAASLKSSGAALRVAGFDFAGSASLIAQLTRAGLPAESVLASLSIAARKLATAGKDPATAIAALVEQIRAAKTPTEALGLASATFGRGAVGITDAIRSGKFELSDFLKVVQGGKATIAGTSAATADAAESFQLLKNNLALALEQPAAQLFGQVGSLVKDLVPELDKLGPSIDAIFGGLGAAATGLLEGLLPVLDGLAPALGPLAEILGQTLAGLGQELGPLAIALGQLILALSPLIGLVGDLVGAMASGLVPIVESLIGPVGDLSQVLADNATTVEAVVVAYYAFQGLSSVIPTILSAGRAVLYVAEAVEALAASRGISTASAALGVLKSSMAEGAAAVSGVGIAAAAGAIGVGLLVKSFLDSQKAAAQTKRSIKELRDEAESTGRSFEDLTKIRLAQILVGDDVPNFDERGLAGLLKNLGVTAKATGDALTGSEAQYRSFRTALQDLGAPIDPLSGLRSQEQVGEVEHTLTALDALRSEMLKSQGQTAAYKQALADLGIQTETTGDSTAGLGTDLGTTGSAADVAAGQIDTAGAAAATAGSEFDTFRTAAQDATDALTGFLDAQQGRQVTQQETSLKVIDAARSSLDLFLQTADGTVSTTEGLLKQSTLIASTQRDINQSLGQLAIDSGGHYDVFKTKAGELSKTLTDQVAGALGISTDKAAGFIAQVFKIPSEVDFQAFFDSQKAKDDLAAITDPTYVATVKVDADIHDALLAIGYLKAAAAAAASVSQQDRPFQTGPGPFRAFALGGIVDTPELAWIGHGPEVILPLGNPARMAELVMESGLIDQLRSYRPEILTDPKAQKAAALGARARDLASGLGDLIVARDIRSAPAPASSQEAQIVGQALDRFGRQALGIIAAAAQAQPLIGSIDARGAGDAEATALAVVQRIQSERYLHSR